MTLTIPITYCTVCDKDTHILDIPSKSCTHREKHQATAQVPVIPSEVTEDMVRRATETIKMLRVRERFSPLDRLRRSAEEEARLILDAAITKGE
jgi:predicted kinase